MRKAALVVLIALSLFGCKKNEGNDAEATLTTIDSSAAPVPETAPPSLAGNATVTDTTSTAVVTATIAPPPAETPTPAVTSTVDPFIIDPPPPRAPQKRPRYDYIVDTYYAWDDDLADEAAKRARGVHAFTLKNAPKIMARRKKDGYEADPPVRINGIHTPDNDPFHYPRTIVVYRKRIS